MKNTFLIFFMILSSVFFAQTPNEILGEELDVFILEQMEQYSIPGLSASIVKGGQVIWKNAYGISNFETNTPVTLQTQFTLASISKLFSATACAQLWENGSLDIDQDINTYLPITIVNPNFPNTPITVRQLLQHKSSLKDSESDLQLWDELGDPIFDLSTFCSSYFVEGGDLYIASNFGDSAPGLSSYWYSNAGFTLLGYIVEEVSEMPFSEYCQANIFQILEMNTAAWFYENLDINNVAMPYNYDLQAYGYYSVPEYPAAMLKANVEELSNFLIAYTQLGMFQENHLVSPKTFSSIVPESMTNGFAWWGTDSWWGDPSGNFWSHGGYMNGVRTQLNYYPNDATGLIILTNGEGNYLPIQNKLEEYISLFEIDNPSSSQDLKKRNILVFPNPTSRKNKLSIQLGDHFQLPVKIQIRNLNGNLISTLETNNHLLSIDISKFPAGMYSLNIMEEDTFYRKKIIIY